MGTAERRYEVMRKLCRRRHDTIGNLAKEFGVSERTILRDVEALSITEPIYTQSGRHVGGVFLIEDYCMTRMYMNESELSVLKQVKEAAEKGDACILDQAQLDLLGTIISQYTKPKSPSKSKK